MSGSLINNLLGSPTQPVPEVGMGATILKWSDRDPVTIVEVKRFKSGTRKGEPRLIVVQYDGWKVVKGHEGDGSAQYEYEPDPQGRKAEYVLSMKGRKAGRWMEKGSNGKGWTLGLGRRERYYDPHI